jgi:hemoglobin
VANGDVASEVALRAASPSFEAMDDPNDSAPLFERLGGRAGIQHLLKHFYADVRQQNTIGPIFRAQIHDWPAHLEKIADFWSGATGGPPHYSGPMPQRHFPLGIGAPHFDAWLDLWRRHCRAHLRPREAEELIRIAVGIGERLQELVARFGAPAKT